MPTNVSNNSATQTHQIREILEKRFQVSSHLDSNRRRIIPGNEEKKKVTKNIDVEQK